MKQTRKKRATRRRRVKRGGAQNALAAGAGAPNPMQNRRRAFDCAAEGFDEYIRVAVFGHRYTIPVTGVHETGERWSYEETVRRSLGGIVDWYRRVLENPGEINRQIKENETRSRYDTYRLEPGFIPNQGVIEPIVPYTEEEKARLNANETLHILVAFFNRYKIVLEKAQKATILFTIGLSSFYPETAIWSKLGYSELLESERFKRLSEKSRKPLEELVRFFVSKLDKNYGRILAELDALVDTTQCLIFYIVKHKGALPDGFVMDERIRQRAREPIILSEDPIALTTRSILPINKMTATKNWLEFLEREETELLNPPVTYQLT